MGVYAAIISTVIGTGVKLLGSSSGPNYPAPPKFYRLPVGQAKDFMESYEQKRMDASVNAWKTRFPLLYKGNKAYIDDLRANQQGKLSSKVRTDLKASGLESPGDSNQYKMALELGLNPLTLAQRTSSAVSRQIAMNPEWTNKISGGTLASMLANANQNQNAFTQFLGATDAAKYRAGQTANSYNTQALLGGLVGAGGAFGNYMTNRDSALSRSTYLQGGYSSGTPSTPPGYDGGSAAAYGWNPPSAPSNGNDFMGLGTPNADYAQYPAEGYLSGENQNTGNVDLWAGTY